MLLTLSSESVRKTTFTNESGQVLYKASHPFTIGTMGTTTIHKIAPNADPTDMRDKFDVMGEIEWHVFGSSTFRIKGEEMQSNDFLPRLGITGWYVVLFLLTILSDRSRSCFLAVNERLRGRMTAHIDGICCLTWWW